MPALAELEQAWCRRARTPPTARAGRAAARLRRPTDAAVPRPRLSERAGRRVYLKREDLNHTGSHKLNNALGQALLARRMGKRRVIAETGAGQHGVATATVCALLGLECVVYMGAEDTRRQRPNVQRMELLGATVQPVDAGAKNAEGGDLGGDPRLGHERREHPLRDRLGRRPGAVPGDRARPAARDRRRGARAAPGARGPAAGAGDRLRGRRLERDRHLRGVPRRRAGASSSGSRPAARDRHARHGAPLTVGGRAGHPARLALGGDAGRGGADHRGALDLGRPRLPGRRARSTPSCATAAARATWR